LCQLLGDTTGEEKGENDFLWFVSGRWSREPINVIDVDLIRQELTAELNIVYSAI